ncbi:serine/threonine-protein phosphatase 4 regulatory subunit 1-like isoform X3 [Vespula maculifrons]|uniref:Serine/threonine-protein phosphatase 4 regulatory subunit 1-like isoform X3 n=1 Tax=Vespula maculifrons TaxID=7453 RepID=A0ABD2CNU9_VESMC
MKAEGGGEVWNGSGGGGDEGGGHIFQLTRLQQHANSDTSFSRYGIAHRSRPSYVYAGSIVVPQTKAGHKCSKIEPGGEASSS